MTKDAGTENQESVNQADETVETPVEETKGLSLRDALEVAIAANKPEEPSDTETEGEVSGGAPSDRGASKPTDGSGKVATNAPSVSNLQAPAEWSAEEKADWASSSPKQQEAALRLHQSRNSKLEEIKTARREYDSLKSLSDSMTPYLKSVGVKKPTEVALKEAVAMWKEFEEGDPAVAAAAYLRAKGKEALIPKDWFNENAPDPRIDEKITPLQNQVNALTMRLAQADQAQATSILSTAWGEFEGEKNAAGKPKYPDVNESEAGLRLSSSIGSLVRGDTELSKQFVALAKSRIPNLTYNGLLAEAYKYCGGQVIDSAVSRTQSTQEHIAKSSRAASSVPGRGAQSTSSGPVKKYKTTREAAAAALADFREREGA